MKIFQSDLTAIAAGPPVCGAAWRLHGLLTTPWENAVTEPRGLVAVPPGVLAARTVAFLFLLLPGVLFANTSKKPEGSSSAKEASKLDRLFLLPIDELMRVSISGATRGPAVVLERAPAIVFVVSRHEIEHSGARTVAEALEGVPGLYILDDLLYVRVGVRGMFGGSETPNENLKVMIDGQRVDFRSNVASFLKHDLIAIDAIERIEVVLGPASTLYGANAVHGVINVVTRDPDDLADLGLGTEAIRLEVMGTGANSKLNASASALSARSWERVKLLVAMTWAQTDRSGLPVPGLPDMIAEARNKEDPSLWPPAKRYPSPAPLSVSREYLLWRNRSRGDRERAGSVFGKLRYGFDNGSEIDLQAHLQYFDRHGEFQGWSFLTHDNRVTYLNMHTRLQWTLDTGAKGWGGRVAGVLAWGRPTGDDALADPLAPGVQIRRIFGYTAADATAEISYSFSATDSVLLGADFTRDWEDVLSLELSQRDGSGQNVETPDRGVRAFTNAGLFLQYLGRPLPWPLDVAAAARLDRDSVACLADSWSCWGERDDGDAGPGTTTYRKGQVKFSNSLSLQYHLPVWHGAIQLVYGTAYKPPSPFQLHHQRSTVLTSEGVENLVPQTSHAGQGQIRLRPTANWMVDATVFRTFIAHVPVYAHEKGKPTVRSAAVDAGGFELTVRWMPLKTRWSVHLAASYLHKNETTPQRRSREGSLSWMTSELNGTFAGNLFPTWMGSLGINVRVPEAASNVHAFFSYASRRPASISNAVLRDPVHVGRGYQLPPRWFMHLTVSSKIPYLVSERDLEVVVALRHAPGHNVEPGYGGIDVPTLGTQVVLQARQWF